MRTADVVAQLIADLGVRHVFLLPGGGNMYLVDAVAQHPDLTPVPCLHEQAAAIAAEAYARVTENIGVVLVTTGPGGTNALTGVVGAWIESVPLLVISGQVKRADLKAPGMRQNGPQEVDIISIVKPVIKYAVTVMHKHDVRFMFKNAIRYAMHGRSGPVWIDIPLDIQGANI